MTLPAAVTSPLQETPPAGRQNPILREFFRAQYLAFGPRAMETTDSPFLESFIDRRIDHFLKVVEQKLDRAAQDSHELQAAQQDLLHSLGTETESSGRAEFQKALGRVQESSDDLHDTLAFVFVNLKHKSKFKERISADASARAFGEEVRYISNRIEAADQRIRHYLFSAKSTVHVVDLQHDNMLISLHEAGQMARRLRKAR